MGGPTNLSPREWLAPLLGSTWAVAVTTGAGLAMLAIIVLRRLDGAGGLLLAMAAACCFTPQLWSHWLLIPAVAGVIAVGESPAFDRLDRRLRALDPARRPRAPGGPSA